MSRQNLIEDPQYTPEKVAARAKYPIITAKDAAKNNTMPVAVKMLVREFIDDSLYHPHYGYFSKQAVIFSPETDFDFERIRDNMQFLDIIAEKYKEIEDDMDVRDEIARQVWHTPTELFKPWYGYAIAKYIVTEYKLNNYPHKDLIIYEMGAGNGTLMLNILDYIQQFEPSVYERTRYRIIEISKKLAQRQGERQEVRDVTKRHGCVEVINKSIFEWDTPVPDHCFFLGMEVLDNFSHDLIRYDSVTEEPLQGMVAIDEDGDYTEIYTPVQDPLIQRYLTIRKQSGYKSPVLSRRFLRRLRNRLPFAPNMTAPEFIPTKLLLLLETLKNYFPQHRLVLSDFYTLPEAIPGVDAPVVQTRYSGTMVPCSTYMVMPGMFDIFFPTNFELLRDIYQQVCRPSLGMEKSVKVQTQKQFLERYGDLEKTRTLSGENPMLMYYENNKMFLS
ncbi:S-adenosyl-L-methionine-dependent methyltransferase [Lobosporangium transversale]|uniref:Protein arginine methyltransferase NDUFAF7 n=1 Tax=Lobosporangium transversale TaxID=64571 RepID=A0A1Y2G676_9FUNG|nr:S-adenosyl-L-methionine-dependent methyltransferase [Lobosporangium transversale]ORY97046.1 S-adenosyl-L-methionine-dependent methyltransferase [Lobosporangium transversale]|eukprot:XP_021875592.1 S-adenosyl-L-methionine-dependent methyltransferase [Lobosporangium transversale]